MKGSSWGVFVAGNLGRGIPLSLIALLSVFGISLIALLSVCSAFIYTISLVHCTFTEVVITGLLCILKSNTKTLLKQQVVNSWIYLWSMRFLQLRLEYASRIPELQTLSVLQICELFHISLSTNFSGIAILLRLASRTHNLQWLSVFQVVLVYASCFIHC